MSDRCAEGKREDASGATIEAWCADRGYVVVERRILADDREAIARTLITWADRSELGLVLTTGGTGLTARDVTPEATKVAIQKEAPGIAEAIRSFGIRKTPLACLSRGVAGARGETLIINLPGGTSGVRDGLEVLGPILEHAVALLKDSLSPHEIGS